MPQPTLQSWILLTLLGLIWGGSFLGVELALTGFSPFWVADIRLALAAVILVIASYAMGHGLPAFSTPVGRKIWLHCFGMALLSNAIPFTLLSWGQTQVTAGFAGITMAVVPLLVLPLAHFLVPGETLSRQKVIGFVIGFMGVAILIGPSKIMQAGKGDLEGLARLACVGAATCYAFGSIVTRRTPPVPALAFSAAAITMAALMLTPVAYFVEGAPGSAPFAAWMSVLYLGLFPTALATILLVYVIKTTGPSFLSMVNYQVPVWAVILGILFLGESLPSQFAGALALILLGLFVAQYRRR